MQLERLKLFCQLIEHGSYSKTAEVLGISKGYLSKQIKLLETELTCQLLIRNTRNMRLTQAGETLYKHAKPLDSFWADTQALMKEDQDTLAGTVTFTSPTGLAKHVLMPLISELNKQHPEIEIVCESGNQTHNLISTPYDFAVRITNTPPDDMVAIKLASFEYICCASPEYIKASGMPSHPKSLSQFNCISLSYWKAWQFDESSKDQQSTFTVNVSPVMQFSDNELLKSAALSNLGITRLPEYLIKKELESGELTALFQPTNDESDNVITSLINDIYLLFPPAINKAQRVQIVIDKIKSTFRHW